MDDGIHMNTGLNFPLPPSEKNPPYNFLKVDTAKYIQQHPPIPDAGGSNVPGLSADVIQAALAPQLAWVERTADISSHRHGSPSSQFVVMADNRLNQQIVGLGLADNLQAFALAKTMETEALAGSLREGPPSSRARPVSPNIAFKPFG